MTDRHAKPFATHATPAALLAGVVLFLASCSEKQSSRQAAEPPGRTAVFAAASDGVNRDRLAGMGWQDIAPTAEATLRNGLIQEVLTKSADVTAAPCLYLRGMLELARSKPEQALAEWGKIDPAVMPADFLYAPWRVSNARKGENRYEAPLARAVESGAAKPLVVARWRASHGDYVKALEAYLKSDPAEWTPHEVNQLRVMKLYAPITADVDLLIGGALKGDRLPEAVRGDLARLLKQPATPDKEQIAAMLKADPALAEAATRAAKRQLELRVAFADNRFAEVVENTRELDPVAVPDETVFLAFLAAAKTGDRQLADQWAEELLRRKPEAKSWIHDIQASSR
jgi:hypothetical protein